MQTPNPMIDDKPADDGGPLYPLRVRAMFGHSLLWVPQSQMAWYDKQEQARPASSPGLWDGH
jgi:hypothetical protein